LSQQSGESQGKPLHEHVLRGPEDFGEKSAVPTFEEANRKYYGRIADRKSRILRVKYRSGKLKKPTSKRRGHVSKAAIFIVILAISLGSTFVVAQWMGQFQAQTQIRSPINVLKQQFIIPDIWVNRTGSWIEDTVFIVNTSGNLVTYTFKLYVTAHFTNGSETQDMTRLFSQLAVTLNDYSQNRTVGDGLVASETMSFSYQCSADQPFRIIIGYITKPVQLGATAVVLTFNFLYSYSGQ